MKRRSLVVRWAVLSLLAMVIFACAKREVQESSIRDRVVAASRGYRDPSEMKKAEGTGYFKESGFAESFYGGDWEVTDPFTDSTRFFVGCSLVSHSYPYVATNQALARSTKSEQQVFFVAGADATLKKRLRDGMKEWEGERVTGFPDTLRTKDGVELEYRVYHIRPGRIAGNEQLIEVGWVEKDGSLLLLDACLSYGRSPDRRLLGQPQQHATLRQLVSGLELTRYVSR